MPRTLRIVGVFAGGFVLLSFGILVVNQTVQVVELATTVHPTLGTITFWTLVTTYSALIGVPVVLFVRLPSPLIPPESEESPEFAAHLRRMGERLASSPHLAGRDVSHRRGIEALGILAGKSDEIVRSTASSVFLATAVSQSGALDGLLVLAAQTRMVWRIAHVYHQRPPSRDLVHLYANVAGTAFIAGELQDLDLGEQVEPVLSAALGALGASLPGLQVAGTILANCVLSGSANAFLTLRVGMIAKRHCGALVVERKEDLRRAATSEAARHLGAIVAEGSGKISKAIWRASVDKVGDAVTGVSGFAKDTGVKLLTKVKGYRAKEQPGIG